MQELPVTHEQFAAWHALASSGYPVPLLRQALCDNPGSAYAILIGGRLYAYGNTYGQAVRVFRAQIAGGLAAARAAMWDRAVFIALEDCDASEIAECICADAIRWE